MPSKAIEHFVPDELKKEDWVVLITEYLRAFGSMDNIRLNVLGKTHCLYYNYELPHRPSIIGFDAEIEDPDETGFNLMTHGIFGVIGRLGGLSGPLNHEDWGRCFLWGIVKGKWILINVRYEKSKVPSFIPSHFVDGVLAVKVTIRETSLEDLLNFYEELRVEGAERPYATLSLNPRDITDALGSTITDWEKRISTMSTQVSTLKASTSFIREIIDAKAPHHRSIGGRPR